MYLIYCHTCRVTAKRYIGYTKFSLEKRWQMHLKNLRKGSTLLFYNAIRKHGEDQWTHDVICENINTLSDAKVLERHFIEMLNTWNGVYGYNMTAGGDGCPPGIQKGRKFSEAHREKLRLAKLGKKTGRKIPPQMASSRRALKGTQGPKDAAKLGWQRRKEKAGSNL